MKIINETVYNSDDLYNLFIAIDRLCWRTMQMAVARWKRDALAKGTVWSESNYYDEQRPLPQELRIGYRTKPKPKKTDEVDAQKKTEPSFVTSSGLHSDSPRFGITRPTDLPISPLVVLAHCAEGANRTLPREVVQALARKFARTRKGWPSDDDCSYLVDDHQVTFSLLVSPKMVIEAKAAANRAKAAALSHKIRIKRDEVNAAEAVLAKRQKQLDTLQARLAKLSPKQEMSLRV